jgi:hypothetical protein
VDLRRPCDGDKLAVSSAGFGEPQVFGDAGVRQVRLLRHHADGRREVGEAHVADVDAVDGDTPASDVVQACHEVAERRLACPVAPTTTRCPPGRTSMSMPCSTRFRHSRTRLLPVARGCALQATHRARRLKFASSIPSSATSCSARYGRRPGHRHIRATPGLGRHQPACQRLHRPRPLPKAA